LPNQFAKKLKYLDSRQYNKGEKMRKMKSKSMVCFGLFRGMELTAFGCGGTLGVISSDDPRVADYTQVATGMYRVYLTSQ